MNEYLHIGDNIIIGKSIIVGIFNNNGLNSRFLEKTGSEFLHRNIIKRPRTFLVAGKSGRNLVYFSKISSKNLIKRVCACKEEIYGKEEKGGKEEKNGKSSKSSKGSKDKKTG